MCGGEECFPIPSDAVITRKTILYDPRHPSDSGVGTSFYPPALIFSDVLRISCQKPIRSIQCNGCWCKSRLCGSCGRCHKATTHHNHSTNPACHNLPRLFSDVINDPHCFWLVTGFKEPNLREITFASHRESLSRISFKVEAEVWGCRSSGAGRSWRSEAGDRAS